MLGEGGGLRWRAVCALGVAFTVIGYLFWRWWAARGGALPAPSMTVGALFACFAVAEWLVARRIRRGVQGQGAPGLDVLWAHRMLLIGQAAALTGALVAGWYLGFIAVALPDADAASVRAGVLAGGVIALGAIALSGGGLRIQAACRIDPPDAGEPSAAAGT